MSSRQEHLAHPKYRPDVDGLRAIAILSVIAFHAFPEFFRGGFVGVDIFFVISGYLISLIILDNCAKGTFSFTEFYSRRIRRIFPALILVMAATLAFGWFTLLGDEYKQLGKHIAGGAAFVANFVLYNEAGYFDNAAETKPLLHLWSLGVEEQFYIVFPPTVWFAFKYRYSVLKLLIVLAATSFLLNVLTVEFHQAFAFFMPQTRFWELMAGGMLAWIKLRNSSISFQEDLKGYGLFWPIKSVRSTLLNKETLTNLTSFIGLLLLILCFFYIQRESFPGYIALIPVLGTLLIILAGQDAWINRNLLSKKVMVWFGLISYPLYIWHWPIFSFLKIVGGGITTGVVRMGAIVVSVAMAWLTYELLEKKIRFGFHARLKGLVLLVMMLIIGLIGYIIYFNEGFGARGVCLENKNINDMFEYKQHWSGWRRSYIVEPPNEHDGGCRVLSDSKPVNVAVIGDSHAGHLASGLYSIFKDSGQNVAVMLYAGCYPFLNNTNCPGDFIDKAFNYVVNTSSIETVVLSGYAQIRIHGSRYGSGNKISKKTYLANLAAFERSLAYTLSLLGDKHKRVIYLVDVPELLVDPRSCVDRSFNFRCGINITKQQYLDRNAEYIALIERFRDVYPMVKFISAADALCDDKFCYGTKGGDLLYATTDHLTPSGSRLLVNHFKNVFLSRQQ